jgi:hypothetical protein
MRTTASNSTALPSALVALTRTSSGLAVVELLDAGDVEDLGAVQPSAFDSRGTAAG